MYYDSIGTKNNDIRARDLIFLLKRTKNEIDVDEHREHKW